MREAVRHDSTVSTVTGPWLDVRVFFVLFLEVKCLFLAHPAIYLVVTGGCFVRLKKPGVNLKNYQHIVPSLTICGGISLLAFMSS
jgi:hypothetical protein